MYVSSKMVCDECVIGESVGNLSGGLWVVCGLLWCPSIGCWGLKYGDSVVVL